MYLKISMSNDSFGSILFYVLSLLFSDLRYRIRLRMYRFSLVKGEICVFLFLSLPLLKILIRYWNQFNTFLNDPFDRVWPRNLLCSEMFYPHLCELADSHLRFLWMWLKTKCMPIRQCAVATEQATPLLFYMFSSWKCEEKTDKILDLSKVE